MELLSRASQQPRPSKDGEVEAHFSGYLRSSETALRFESHQPTTPFGVHSASRSIGRRGSSLSRYPARPDLLLVVTALGHLTQGSGLRSLQSRIDRDLAGQSRAHLLAHRTSVRPPLMVMLSSLATVSVRPPLIVMLSSLATRAGRQTSTPCWLAHP